MFKKSSISRIYCWVKDSFGKLAKDGNFWEAKQTGGHHNIYQLWVLCPSDTWAPTICRFLNGLSSDKEKVMTSKSHEPCLSHSLSQKCFSDHFLVLLEHLWESDSSCHWEVYIRDRQPHQEERPSPGLNGRCDVWCPICDCVPWPQRWVSVSHVAWEKDTGSPPRPPTHPPLERDMKSAEDQALEAESLCPAIFSFTSASRSLWESWSQAV